MRRIWKALATTVVAGALVGMAPAGANVTGPNQGCSPGYWKNHTSAWQEYTTTTQVGKQWTFPAALSSFKTETFIQAIQGGGGPGLNGAVTILMRAAVASYLNAADDSVGYPLRRAQPSPYAPWSSDPRFANGIKGAVNAALASLDRPTILSLATTLDNANNLSCPLN